MTNSALAICASEAKSRLKALPPGTTVEEKLAEAFKATHNHWMVLDEDTQFRAAIAAVHMTLEDGEDKERLERAIEALKMLSAMISGIPVDMEAMAERLETDQEPLKLRDIYREAVGV